MLWALFSLGAALFWGMYGPILHKGQLQLGSPLRALLCVGFAYFLVGVLIPGGVLASTGQLKGFNWPGVINASIGEALGALGAICIIYAFATAACPTTSCRSSLASPPGQRPRHRHHASPKQSPNPLLYLGYVLASAGAGLVLYFKPA